MTAGSTEGAGFGVEPPEFQPQLALLQLQRALRDLKLAERHGGFELRGRRVAELRVGDSGSEVLVRLARNLALTPHFDSTTLKSATDQRRWLDELKKRLARWDQED